MSQCIVQVGQVFGLVAEDGIAWQLQLAAVRAVDNPEETIPIHPDPGLVVHCDLHACTPPAPALPGLRAGR